MAVRGHKKGPPGKGGPCCRVAPAPVNGAVLRLRWQPAPQFTAKDWLCLVCLRFLRNDGDEKRVAIGIRELMSIQVGAMLDGLVQLKTVVLYGMEVVDVLQNHAFPIRPGLA